MGYSTLQMVANDCKIRIRQHALLVQKDFLTLFHPKPNECVRFDLESCDFMCTYTVVYPPMSHSTTHSGSPHDALHLD